MQGGDGDGLELGTAEWVLQVHLGSADVMHIRQANTRVALFLLNRCICIRSLARHGALGHGR